MNLLGLFKKKRSLKITAAFAPVYLDSIKLICPDCGAWGMWSVPEGFRVAISDKILVICENGHSWAISGAYERINVEQR
jgi:hypothetical protein